MKPPYAIIILGPLIGFGIGAGVDRAFLPQTITESSSDPVCIHALAANSRLEGWRLNQRKWGSVPPHKIPEGLSVAKYVQK